MLANLTKCDKWKTGNVKGHVFIFRKSTARIKSNFSKNSIGDFCGQGVVPQKQTRKSLHIFRMN